MGGPSKSIEVATRHNILYNDLKQRIKDYNKEAGSHHPSWFLQAIQGA